MQMYLSDFHDVFPAANKLGSMTEEEWLRWNTWQSLIISPEGFRLGRWGAT